MNRLPAVTLLAALSLLASNVPRSAAELPDDSFSYWLPYAPGKNAIALYPFEPPAPLADLAGKAPAMTLPDGVTLAPDGRFGAGLAFAAGHAPLTVTLGESLFDQKRFVIDFWLRTAALPAPGASAVILDKPHVPGQANGFRLAIEAGGAVVWTHRTLSSTGTGQRATHPEWCIELRGPPGTIKPGTWHHVAVYVGAYTHVGGSDIAYLAVDGVRLAEQPNGWMYINYTATEAGRTAFTLGGTAASDAFVGTLDQFRVVSGLYRRFWPAPDESWTDPERRRPLPDDPACVAAATDVLFRAEFEDGLVATVAGGNPKPVRAVGQPIYAPGVRGKALRTVAHWAPLEYACNGNLNPHMGAVELWIKPLNWQQLGTTLTGFFRVENGHMLFIPNDGFALQISGGMETHEVEYPPDTWTHLAMVWADRHVVAYVNGEQKLEGLMPAPFDAAITNGGMLFGFGKEMLIDDATVYRRPLSPVEVRNHYLRYFSGQALAPLPPLDVVSVFLQGVGKLLGVAYPRSAISTTAVSARVALRDGSRVLRETAVPYAHDAGAAFLMDGLPVPLRSTNASLRVDLLDAGGQAVASAPVPFSFRQYPWLGNTIGITNRVLKPWEPLRAKGRDIAAIGRRHTLGRGGLLDALTSQGHPLLAAPMRIELAHGAETNTLEGSGLRVTLAKPHEVRWSGRLRGAAGDQRLDVGVEGLMEYDGHTVYTFRFASPPGRTTTVDRLSLVLPLTPDWVKMYLMIFGIGLPHGTGVAPNAAEFAPGAATLFSSKLWYEHTGWDGSFQHTGIFDHRQAVAVEQRKAKLQPRWKPTLGNFIPQLWIGSDTFGLAYMADSDRGWVPTDAEAAVTLARAGEAVEWRFNFIAEPFALAEPRSITLSFQATPEKPQPVAWRKTFWRGPPRPDAGVTCQWLSDSAGWDEEGVGAHAYHPEGSQRATDAMHVQGLKVTPHLDTSAMNWGKHTAQAFSAEWDSGGFQYNQIFTRSRIDFSVWSLWRWKQQYGIDGVYFDTGTPLPNRNTLTGTAYLLPDGRVQPGWTMFGQREYYKRAAHIFGNIGTEGFNWSCGYTGPQIAGWQFASVPGGEYRIDYAMDRYPGPFDFMRTLSNGGHFGTLMMWMGLSDYVKRGEPDARPNYEKFMRHMYAMMLPLDAKWSFGSFNYPQGFYAFSYADDDTRFVGFWDNPCVAYESPAEGMRTSLYLKPSGRALAILTNLADEPNRLALRFDAKAMGFDPARATVLDGERLETPKPDEPLNDWYRRIDRGGRAVMPGGDESLREIRVSPLADGLRVKLLVPPRDFRLLDVAPE